MPARTRQSISSMAEYLRGGLPNDASGQNEPALTAWSEILQNGEVDRLFDPSLLPDSPSGSAQITASPSAQSATVNQPSHPPQ